MVLIEKKRKMVKEHYKKELEFSGVVQKGDTGFDVQRIQEWLVLNTFTQPSFKCKCSVDRDFGPQTRKAVIEFQNFSKIEEDGVVGPQTWAKLVYPLSYAFDMKYLERWKESKHHPGQKEFFTVRDAILAVSKRHLIAVPRELGSNEGPWVRSYMGGHDGEAWAWCVGSTLTIIDQAMSLFGMKFTDYLPNTYSCDTLANSAIKKKTLIRNADLKKMSLSELNELIKPGDIMNVVKNSKDWTHTALITKVHEDHFETWEGNTNDEGSREGFEVCTRKRNFHRQNIDVILLNL